MNCPRCGFSQPKDQYCAQCGVDMLAFKPKEVPLFTQIIQSTKTHIVVLLLVAAFVGQYVIRSEEPQRWVQKITHSQGVTRTKAKFDENTQEEQTGVAESASQVAKERPAQTSGATQLDGLRNKEISVNANVEQPIQTGSAAAAAASAESNGAGAEVNEPTFRITYAEAPTALVNKWVQDSSNAGLYQNLQEYSAGVLAEYRKKTDSSLHVLKVSEKKLALGQSDTGFSGAIGEDSGQMLGLATALEFRSQENGIIHGSIVVNRTHRQGRDNFPAEFDLPRGAAFFMVGALKPNSFQTEREQLNMPPFQIFKSPDFAAHKTEFVIIVEPEYK